MIVHADRIDTIVSDGLAMDRPSSTWAEASVGLDLAVVLHSVVELVGECPGIGRRLQFKPVVDG